MLLRASCSCFFLSHYNFRWHAGTHNTKGRMIYSRQCLLSLWHSEKAYMRTIHWHLRVASCMTLIRIRKHVVEVVFGFQRNIGKRQQNTSLKINIRSSLPPKIYRFSTSSLLNSFVWALSFASSLQLPFVAWKLCNLKANWKIFSNRKGQFLSTQESFLCFFCFYNCYLQDVQLSFVLYTLLWVG